mmetsp:Transcript_6693/g.14406  ORF Transcript_6693/g.14406 Transcript_6693/m.14406 type:complete len:422 (-) Transcript_6693:306-1571(-)
MSNFGAKGGRLRRPSHLVVTVVAVVVLVAANFANIWAVRNPAAADPDPPVAKPAPASFAPASFAPASFGPASFGVVSTRSTLPSKIYTVAGLESSGTHFVSGLLAEALRTGPYRDGSFINRGGTDEVRVQHVSLPQGDNCDDSPFPPIQKVVLPGACSSNWDAAPANRSAVPDCVLEACSCAFLPKNETLLRRNLTFSLDERCAAMARDTDQTVEDGRVVYPRRYLFDLVANKEWYDARGVEQWYVIVVRDQTASRMSRKRAPVHCSNDTLLEEEEEIGTDILVRTIRKYILEEEDGGKKHRKLTAATMGEWYRETFPEYVDIAGRDRHDPARLRRRLTAANTLPSGNNVVLVSYETLMKLPEIYIKLFYDTMGIASEHFPTAKDGNKKYMLTPDSPSEDEPEKLTYWQKLRTTFHFHSSR